MSKELEPKIEMYAYIYEQEKDTYNIQTKPIHTFKNLKEFEETSGIYAMSYFMRNPLKSLGFCYCEKGQDITNKEYIHFATYGFMEGRDEQRIRSI